MIYDLTSDTAIESPVLVDEVRNWLKEPPAEDDPLIDFLIQSACRIVEEQSGVGLSSRQYVYTATVGSEGRVVRYSNAPPETYVPAGHVLVTGLRLPRKPVTAVASVSLVDADGTEAALVLGTDYYVSLSAGAITFPAALVLSEGARIEATFTAGHASAASVPEVLREAVMLSVADRYENRTSIIIGQNVTVLPNAVRAMLTDAGFGRVSV